MKREIEKKEEVDYAISQVMQWLMPWEIKTGGAETIGDWEVSLSITMMKNLLDLWLTEDGKVKVEKMLHVYHPLDRAALIYAVLVYLFTGNRMNFKNVVVRRHFRAICNVLKEDMVELTFSDHLKRMLRKYGKKK
jgi:hypothetical protein